jgi:hypothetical protein
MSATTDRPPVSEKTRATEGREANGRFASGNPGGPGNPHARQLAEYKKAMLAVVSIERLNRILDAIAKKAEDGDVAAAKLILQYTLGKPTTPVDPDRLSFDEWVKMREQALPPREMGEVMNCVPAQQACDLTKIAWPCAFQTNFGGPIRELLKARDEQEAARAAKGQRPSPNGENGGRGSPRPTTSGPDGATPDWWDQAVDEVLAETRKEAPDHRSRRKKKRRKHAASR